MNVTVTDSLGVEANATAAIHVTRSPILRAVIQGGNRTAAYSTSLTLDASGSADPDLQSNVAKGLSYAWTCIRGGGEHGKACNVTIASSATPTATFHSSGTLVCFWWSGDR